MLQHVEMIVTDDSVHFAPCVNCAAELRYLSSALKASGFQSGGKSETVQSCTLGSWTFSAPGSVDERCLRPIDPDAKFQAVLVGIVCDWSKTVGKFLGVGVPVAYTAKPSGSMWNISRPSSAESRIMRCASVLSICIPPPQLLLTSNG